MSFLGPSDGPGTRNRRASPLTQIVLDLSRLLSRAGRSAPTGIDRVELAYAKHFMARHPERLSLTAVTSWGRFGLLPLAAAKRFVAALDAVWQGHAETPTARRRAVAAARKLRLYLVASGETALRAELRQRGRPAVYLLVSHHHLDRPAPIARLKKQAGARFACLVHDLIPIEYPEFARPGQAERHEKRITTVARLADAVIVNSDHTGSCLELFLKRKNRAPRVLVAPLGIDLPLIDRSSPVAPGQPYFICVGTIEPKKNHLLLLNLWRRLAADMGPRAPRLVLVGERGWEIENVVDMIERSIPLRRLVDEQGPLSDAAMARMLSGARALLMPTFAEGYGLPVAEALKLGTPVLCSDLPSLRALGKEVPEYLDPLDGPAWYRAIVDYMAEDSGRRAAQLRRLVSWRVPGWEAHFAAVDALLDGFGRIGDPGAEEEPSAGARRQAM
jgi:glycosyltransferase involved in cell wall biosynthesis